MLSALFNSYCDPSNKRKTSTTSNTSVNSVEKELATELRRYSLACASDDKSFKKMKCQGCKKSLDSSSIILINVGWHKKCFKCSLCNKQLNGSIHMLNNQPFDSTCYHHLQTRPNLQRSQTNSSEYQYERKYSQIGQKKMQYFQRTHSSTSKKVKQIRPNINMKENIRKLDKKRQFFQRTHSSTSKSNENQSSFDETPSPTSPTFPKNPEQLTPEMKKKLANDLLSSLMSIRSREIREMRQRLEQQEEANKLRKN
uniref:LIM zinc-binding domain-containing protein n=2 Tax=Panagrolaimus sp. JU765 TaxID=591449 RepID=A0AC34RQA8_9BILA